MAKRPAEAHIPVQLFEVGIGNVIVTRFKASGDAECGMFLLDVHCLGVKNAMSAKMDAGEYEEYLQESLSQAEYEQRSASCARKLVEEAVRYARDLGFPPHRDFKKAWRVMGGVDSNDCDCDYTFGCEGKPLFVQGPNDTPAFCKNVMRKLGKHMGPDEVFED